LVTEARNYKWQIADGEMANANGEASGRFEGQNEGEEERRDAA
jgi:hypothetical protein